MRVCYLHLSRFPVQRRVLETPSLAGKPLALSEESRGTRRVVFASSSALRAGIRPGMTVASAQALEAQLAVLPYALADERAALHSLGEALMTLAPAFQLDAPDGLWLDAAASALCGGDEGLGRRALDLCASHGYRARVVMASQLFTARTLARFGTAVASPAIVANGEAPAALAPVALEALEGVSAGGVGREAVQALRSLGLSSLGEVAALPVGSLAARLGPSGLLAHRLCRGEDDTRLLPEPLAEVFEEEIALDWPAESVEPLLFALKTVLDRLCARLSGRRRAAVRLTLRLCLESRGERPLAIRLARPTAQRKLLLDLVRHQLEDVSLDSPIAALKVRVDETSADDGQQLVWDDEPQGEAALEVVLSRLSSTLGEQALMAAEPVESHRPERAYALKEFHPPVNRRSGGAGLLDWSVEGGQGGSGEMTSEQRELLLKRPARLFEAAAELPTEVGAKGELLAARIEGQRRPVVAMAGPERLCGDWWAEVPYLRDYYRVLFEGMGPVWLYRDARDGRFYLQGMFD